MRLDVSVDSLSSEFEVRRLRRYGRPAGVPLAVSDIKRFVNAATLPADEPLAAEIDAFWGRLRCSDRVVQKLIAHLRTYDAC